MQPQVTEVGDGAFAVAASHCNFGIVLDGAAVTLIDSGYPGDRELIGAALGAVGRNLTNVETVILTHGHVDHLGSAEWLRREHDVAVHVHRDEAAQARGERRERITELALARNLWRPGVITFLGNALAKGGLKPEHVQVVEVFEGDAPLDVPGHPVPVHTPGHTSGHAGFHLPERGVLFTGDALITVDLWDESDRGPQLVRPEFNHDHDQAAASLGRFGSLEAAAVVPGHGRPYRGSPAQAVEEALARL